MMDQITTALFSANEFRIRAALEQGPYAGSVYGDHMLNPDLHDRIVPDKLHDAAVLVPVVDHGAEATVILTKRAEKLKNHSGQIAFPGGKIDPTDVSPVAAALREADEEIGLDRHFVDVVGRMPDYVTGSGYRITPVLGIVRPGFQIKINEHEVDNVFEVPLRFLMDPANHRRDSRVFLERERFFYTMPYERWNIWGVTAGVIRTVYERLYA